MIPPGYLATRSLIAVCALLLLAGCSGGGSTPGPQATRLEDVDGRVLSACTTMGLRLFGEVVRQGSDRNVMLSPPSVHLALSMAYNGARGETQAAMADLLAVSGMSLPQVNEANALLMAALQAGGSGVSLKAANSLWARQGFPIKADFIQRCCQSYSAEARELDFADPGAPAIINDWVSGNTAGKIPTIVDSISAEMVLYLINAIYFKGSWAEAFDPALTHDGVFTLADGAQISTPLMSRSGSYAYYRGEGFQAVHLPYGDGKVGMYVLVPGEGSSLADLSGRLSAANWSTWMAQFRPAEVDLSLPRFRFDYNVTLNAALSALGMGVAFQPGVADLGGISGEGLYISEVRHKSFVEVNEEGTEATAATSVGVGVTSAPERVAVRADRPFLFAIRHNPTGTLLFLGVVVDPRS